MSRHKRSSLSRQDAATIIARLGQRSIVMVGMMGAGKTAVGKRLAQHLGLPFYDADAEIEAAAQQTIPELFEKEGEAFFRDKEKLLIARLLATESPIVLATGGGAYMHPATREAIRACAISIWLRAEPDVLMRRVRRKSNRPLLKTADPEGTLKKLLDVRSPLYAQADIAVESLDVSHEEVLKAVLQALSRYLEERPA